MIKTGVFGYLEGKEILKVTIENAKGASVTILSLGATIHSICVPDKEGKLVDVCLGYNTVGEYLENTGYVGATIGRWANRIGGSKFTLNGKEYAVDPNEGKNHLHGGAGGFDKKLWTVAIKGDKAVFSCRAPHMESGYPGNFKCSVSFGLSDDNCLSLDYEAVCDEDTIANLTNHAYFNLAGHASGSALDHVLTLDADTYTVNDDESIPTGEIASVRGTVLDFTSGKPFSDGIDDASIAVYGGFDHNFPISGEGMHHAARVYCPESGITMDVETTLEGIQLYTANHLTDRKGKNGAFYRPHNSFCLETQHYPDSINHENFPSPILKKGEVFHHTTHYKFSV
ncbi:MAG: galactose mutarotase [Oscillospiraceae bacterium]|nr:galactose mutarotase [Oscillospiraceae bacterium]